LNLVVEAEVAQITKFLPHLEHGQNQLLSALTLL